MSEAQHLKQHLMQMAVNDVELLFVIIGDLGYPGYRVCLLKLKGMSLQQCATKCHIKRRMARYSWEKCVEKGYDEKLKELFGIKDHQ